MAVGTRVGVKFLAIVFKGTVSPFKLMRQLKIHRNCLEWLGSCYSCVVVVN